MIKLALILLLAASLNAMPKNFEDTSPNQQGNQDEDEGRANPPNRGTNQQHRHAAAAARLVGNRAANQDVADALDYNPMQNEGDMDPDRGTGIGTSRRRSIPNAVRGGRGPSMQSRSSRTQGASAGGRLNFRLELPTQHYPDEAPPIPRGNSISAQNQARIHPVQPALTMFDLQQANANGYRMVTDPRTGREIPSVSIVEGNRRARRQQQQDAENDLRQDQEYNWDEDEVEDIEDWQVDGYDGSSFYQRGNDDFDPPQGGTGVIA
ncbi:hypothetical protein MP228_010822 [Amoeboaphelidium protococcarum]|nr:hypothetical protein MP228_010822 [Amoeboaphelidium protococcarum]